jgi:hypothetical protein
MQRIKPGGGAQNWRGWGRGGESPRERSGGGEGLRDEAKKRRSSGGWDVVVGGEREEVLAEYKCGLLQRMHTRGRGGEGEEEWKEAAFQRLRNISAPETADKEREV